MGSRWTAISIMHMSYCCKFQQKIQESRIEKSVKEYG